MQNPGVGAFVPQNACDLGIRVARVHDQRQAAVLGCRDMGAKDLFLNLARAVIVVEIQSGLADADDLRMLRQRASRAAVIAA